MLAADRGPKTHAEIGLRKALHPREQVTTPVLGTGTAGAARRREPKHEKSYSVIVSGLHRISP